MRDLTHLEELCKTLGTTLSEALKSIGKTKGDLENQGEYQMIANWLTMRIAKRQGTDTVKLKKWIKG